MREYKLISGDSHVLEPPDLWLSRVPDRFKGRAPRMIRMEKGDAWIFEGALDPLNFGLNQNGGLPKKANLFDGAWIRWEDARKAGYDPAARIKEIDQDGVDAEVLYCTPRYGIALSWNTVDTDFHVACIAAYNDWMGEFCSYAPDRLKGLAMLPNIGVDIAIKEMHRAVQMPGMCGVNILRYPSGSFTPTPEDDRFWAAAQEAGVPVSVHVSFAAEPAGEHHRIQSRNGMFRHMDAPLRAQQMITSGVFDRFPKLQLVFAEVDCGWVPYIRERMEPQFERRRSAGGVPAGQRSPKDVFDNNISWVYITDHFGVKSRHAVGLNSMMWSSDFPHGATHWPHSWDVINQDFEGAPMEEKRQIVAGNAARVYHIQ